jgi:hypothetical protein
MNEKEAFCLAARRAAPGRLASRNPARTAKTAIAAEKPRFFRCSSLNRGCFAV